MTADAGTDVVVADAHQPDGLAGIVGQAVGRDAFRQGVAGDELEGDGKVLVDEPLHLALYLAFLLSRGLVVEPEGHLALLALNMGIEGAFAAEDPYHRLVQEMFRRMCGWKLLLVVLVENIIVHC